MEDAGFGQFRMPGEISVCYIKSTIASGARTEAERQAFAPNTQGVGVRQNEVIALLEINKNERGMVHWRKLGSQTGLRSFGIGLTQLRKIARQIGRDHTLAKRLWRSKIYDARGDRAVDR